jgi:hypothetical protein
MKQNKTTPKDLLSLALREQQFYRLKCTYLLSVLDEIKSFSGELEKKVIDNAMERSQLDNLIHAHLPTNNK